jgi:AbrB family looped-hinge helix DNA binding protein
LELTFKAKVGKKHVVVIPKPIAERLNLYEGSKVIIKATEEGKIIIEPIRDAVWLSLHGEKVAHVTLKELKEESLEQQGKYIKE